MGNVDSNPSTMEMQELRREMERIGANSTLPSEEYDEDGLIENSLSAKGRDDRFTKCGRI